MLLSSEVCASGFYLNKFLMQSFSLEFEVQRATRTTHDTGPSDVRLAPDRVRECEDTPRVRAHAHSLALHLT